MNFNLKIKKQFRRLLLCSVFVLILVFSGAMGIAAADESPEAVLKQCVSQSLSIINDPVYKNTPEKELVHKILFNQCGASFDFRAVAMGVLGRNWRRFSPEQRRDFIKYFSHLLAQVYFAKIDKKSIKDISIQYIKTEMLSPTRSGIARAAVTSQITHNGIKTPVIYKMLKRKHGQWKIYDLKIEGVSLVLNYREQYRNKFKDTPEQIIQELKKKVNM